MDISKILPILQQLAVVLGGVSAIATALGVLFSMLGLAKAAAACKTVGVDVQKILAAVRPLVGSARAMLRRGPPAGPCAMLLVACWQASCLPAVATVPVTPDNQSQVSACQSIAGAHNELVIGDFVVGGAAPVLAGIGTGLASSDPGAGKALGITATVLGAVAMTGAGLTALEASGYASNGCSQVLGPLPVMPAAKKHQDAGADAGAK